MFFDHFFNNLLDLDDLWNLDNSFDNLFDDLLNWNSFDNGLFGLNNLFS